MFAEERPALRPLPVEPFRYYQFGTRTVHLDGCVEVESAYYAPPPGWLGRDVAVQWDGVHVRLLHPTTGALLREHRRQAPGRHAILVTLFEQGNAEPGAIDRRPSPRGRTAWRPPPALDSSPHWAKQPFGADLSITSP